LYKSSTHPSNRKTPITLRLPNDLVSIMDELSEAKGVNRSTIAIEALSKSLKKEAADSALIIKEIVRQNNQVARVVSRLDVLAETFLVYVSVWFERHGPITDESLRADAKHNMLEGMNRFRNAVKADITSSSKTDRLYELLSTAIPELTASHKSELSDDDELMNRVRDE